MANVGGKRALGSGKRYYSMGARLWDQNHAQGWEAKSKVDA